MNVNLLGGMVNCRRVGAERYALANVKIVNSISNKANDDQLTCDAAKGDRSLVQRVSRMSVLWTRFEIGGNNLSFLLQGTSNVNTMGILRLRGYMDRDVFNNILRVYIAQRLHDIRTRETGKVTSGNYTNALTSSCP